MAEISTYIHIEASEYDALKLEVIEEIIAHAKRGYGFRFVSRESGEELCDDAVRGSLLIPVTKAMKSE